MKIAVIGAGPAGLTSAKQAIERGHDVVVFETHRALGGIWNPESGGAYPGVRMQSSRLSYPYSDHPASPLVDFPTLAEMHAYLRGYAERFGVTPLIRFGAEVRSVVKRGEGWIVDDGEGGTAADAVMVASGELWEPRRLQSGTSNGRLLTAKDYRSPAPFEGKHVLVVGGGVSGADIAAELAEAGVKVDWSVRRKALFLPRMCGEHFNDALFSYAGRLVVESMPHANFLALLEAIAPAHMADCRGAGLLPEGGFRNAVHVNDRIVPAVAEGRVRLRPATSALSREGEAAFADGRSRGYDAVIQCIGYGMPNYGFLKDFDRRDLYEHFLQAGDPTLAIINTPVDTDAFGTACPYFEAIAGWVLRVFEGEVTIPPRAERLRWCAAHMGRLADRRHYDCWLETIRLGLMSGTLPHPGSRFADYWRLVSGIVRPDNLRASNIAASPAPFDDPTGLARIRLRLLAALSPRQRAGLVATGQIEPEEDEAAARIPASDHLDASLPYRMREPGPLAGDGRAVLCA